MSVSFQDYLLMLVEAVNQQEGPHLAYLLRPTSSHAKDLLKQFRNPTKEALERQYQGTIAKPWDDIAIEYVLVVHAIAKERPTEAFERQSKLVSNFYRYLQTSNGWTLSALFALLRDLRDIAHDADIAAQETRSMEEAARIITKAFTHCVVDRTSTVAESRKWGVYYVVGLVMKCYFRIKRLALCKNILRALDANQDLPPLTAYPKAHQVTYRYYLGTLNFLNENYEKAEEELGLAYADCYSKSLKNQERIMVYLIPLRLMRGLLPSNALLAQIPSLDEVYTPFINALRRADVKAYDEALDKWERRLLEMNVWLVFERARELVMRGLFRKVWLATEQNTRIPIHMFHCAVRVVGIRVEVEEVECYIANMIYKGLIKGYISHERQMVVLASNGAFPGLIDRKNTFLSY